MENENLFFVYGTLKRNFTGNRYLANSSYLGEAVTTDEYSLYRSFFYPAMILEPSSLGVHGEIFRVSDSDKVLVDEYEGVEFNLYKCLPIQISKLNLLDQYRDLVSAIMNGSSLVHAYIYQGKLAGFEKTDYWP